MKKLILLLPLLFSGCKNVYDWTYLKTGETLFVYIANDNYSHTYSNNEGLYKIKYTTYGDLTIDVVTMYNTGQTTKDRFSGKTVSYLHSTINE